MKKYLISHLTSVGLTAILFVLTTFSIWATLATQQVVNRTAVSEYLTHRSTFLLLFNW